MAARELPRLRVSAIDVDGGAWWSAVLGELAVEEVAPESAWRVGQRYTPRRRLEEIPVRPITVVAGATYLVTGGGGALGRRFAEELARRGAGHVVLAGRRAPSIDGPLAGVAEGVACDVADAGAVGELLSSLAARGKHPRGIVHAAGVLTPRRVGAEDPARFREALRAKVDGAWNFHGATQEGALDWLILVSSVATHLPVDGQSAYAAGNGFLDALAQARQRQGLPTTSVALGPTDEGMTQRLPRQERARLDDLGVAVLPAGEAVAAVCDAGVDRDTYGLYRLNASAQRRETGGGGLRAKLSAAAGADAPRVLRDGVMALVRRVLEIPEETRIEDDEPWASYGLDSLLALDLRELLSRELDVALPHSLAYDHPTLGELCGHLAETLGLAVSTPPAVTRAPAEVIAGDAIAIVGVACRLPGGAEDLDGLWRVLHEGRDPVVPIPPGRFDAGRSFEPWPPAAGKSYVRAAALLDAIDTFDAGFFGLSATEAASLDPQQRLLLETAWEALEDAGIAPDRLAGTRTGVIVGLTNHDYACLLYTSPSPRDS